MSDLIKKSKKIKKELDLDNLEKAGIRTQRENYEDKTSYRYHLIFKGNPLTEKEIFCLIPYNKITRLYVHIPFCIHLCPFCCFYTSGNQPKHVVNEYLIAIKKEFDLLLEKTQLRDANIKSIYFGGGTPTYLTSQQLTEVINYFKERLNINQKYIFTCEVSPNTITDNTGKKKLEVLLENGVNRLSIGIQSFNNDILKVIGAGHDVKTAISSIKTAREVGFDDIDIDLIYGLPDQTLEKWEQTLDLLTNLKPESIDLYHLRLYFIRGPVTMHKMFVKEPSRFPDEDTNLLMRIMAFKRLTESGYTAIDTAHHFTLSSRSHYSSSRLIKQGFLSMVGLGPFARTETTIGTYRNHLLEEYIKKVKCDRLPFFSSIKLTKRQLMEREIIYKLRDINGLNKKDFETKFGVNVEKVFGFILQKFEKLGLIMNSKNSIKLTYKGQILADDIIFEHFLTQK